MPRVQIKIGTPFLALITLPIIIYLKIKNNFFHSDLARLSTSDIKSICCDTFVYRVYSSASQLSNGPFGATLTTPLM